MKVLVACEESQAVCKAFRARGDWAFSCDIQSCSGGHPEWHIVGNALDYINGHTDFITEDGREVMMLDKWDLLIAHPPCTYLTKGAAQLVFNRQHQIRDQARYDKGVLAAEFFMQFYQADCERICVENPVPLKCWALPAYTQIIQPYQFGEPFTKSTCLWLRGLPELRPTNIVKPIGQWVGAMPRSVSGYSHPGVRSAKERSKTFPGIAAAMAEQWGDLSRIGRYNYGTRF